VTLNHHIRLALDGYVCTCGHRESLPGDDVDELEKKKAAARHQFAVFLHEARKAGDQIATTCLACGSTVTVPAAESDDRLAAYSEWIHEACPSCGVTPVDAVGQATVYHGRRTGQSRE
jgi:hypothetical protein